ncbi:MAG: DNA-directed RNA polymerase subunit beta, partial [Prevotella denticola]
NSFFGTNPLSQFMDQTNPLAEVTHKRRLSALGPGGLSRERAGFEVRDVHYTHYGRLCPIESPEGPNIGLISSLCMYAKINDLGFIVTPYRRVKDSKVDMDNKDVVFLTAEEEEDQIIGQGNAPLNDDGTFIRETVKCRQDADYPVVGPDSVNLIDVSPQQIASVSAGLIPFLEHDDGHRALMGCNMMRQAVPLLHNDAPIVGTGLEKQVCEDSRTMVTAEGDGIIEYVDATTIRILYDRTEEEEFVSFEPALKEYRIPKFRRTNQNMVVDLRPICDKGQRVKKGDILTEGYATENGELALGRNLLVAYMPWKGYNYEDAVVISERMVREDVLTSVHVDEYSLEVRETKRGVEEFTSDIPNVSEEATKDLDDNGIIRVGARVEPGDIMIGKISPKGESDPSPEEKLLRAIFGDKAGDVKDSSLKANPSLSGVVIDKKLFSRAIKTRESKRQDKVTLAKIDEEQEAKVNDLKDLLVDKLLELTADKVSEGVKDYSDAEIITKGSKFTVAALKNLDYEGIQSNGWTDDEHTNLLIQKLIMNYIRKYKQMDAELKRRKFAITIGDELPSGVLQMAKVYIAKKRKIQVGDKLAGRHGNKGIVSKVVRTEDMPFLEDGSPVDLVLNPMGVPSRMNLGQIFEAILGAAGRKLGVKFATPIFDGAKLSDLKEWTDKAGLPNLCSTYIYDGETGEKFDQPATVGITYFLKLGHMVEDKMHARSIGPYSLITQQPLGGKAQFGGQRFGEMEVWAIEAFGASHVLQEILTIKSDDVVGRSKAYEAIVKGEPMPTPGIPESLNVLLHELRGLGLSIKLD